MTKRGGGVYIRIETPQTEALMKRSLSFLAVIMAAMGLFFTAPAISNASDFGRLGPHSPGVLGYAVEEGEGSVPDACAHNLLSAIPSKINPGQEVCVWVRKHVAIAIRREDIAKEKKELLDNKNLLLHNPKAYYKKKYTGSLFPPTLDEYLAEGLDPTSPRIQTMQQFIRNELQGLDTSASTFSDAYQVTVFNGKSFPRVKYMTLAKNFPIKRLNNWPHVFPEAESHVAGRKSTGALKTVKSLSSFLQQ